ncbi:RND family efflux transporter, MFP subunit [Salinimicrobium catena]|uniref:RND family efflux transporter, MFP subunit n=1 Tax=Salinimicrobium catena TaxID=390640 RepID=A0A1H5MW59_9FLAO|nr:efflux RND transporter periplasmic adaptor subunit [Salinimicrobium catena]SDL30733.1 RND family efflux transporter, MFP subunit [Salinimicrobium catena]SEE93380.1 RND family efflux transporter, MFP subunit [Salinimicrobium catena]
MKKTIYTLALATLGLFATSCGSDEKKEAINEGPVVPVRVETPSGAGERFLTASGKIEAVNSANLSTRMMGFIEDIHVKVGDKVNKGELLVSINNSDLQAKRAQVNAGITEAEAAYNNAKKDYERFKALYEKESASQKEMDDQTARFEMAKARLEAAKQMKNEVNSQFAYVNIRAPFSGVITNKFAEEGTMANPGQPLLAIESPGKFEVMARVPESEISRIETGTKVDVNVKSIDQTIPGTVSEVSTSARNTGGQYMVKIALEDTEAKLLSGMYATVRFPIEKKEETASQAVMIPQDAIITRGDLQGVYTVSSQNTAMLRWLRLGRTYGDQVEVLSGLNPEEAYIVSADGKLFNGAKVSVKE